MHAHPAKFSAVPESGIQDLLAARDRFDNHFLDGPEWRGQDHRLTQTPAAARATLT